MIFFFQSCVNTFLVILRSKWCLSLQAALTFWNKSCSGYSGHSPQEKHLIRAKKLFIKNGCSKLIKKCK
uniref:Secreted protein n=1 Tax=Arundo donax TaxID=35708 RepID=A0A0A9ENY8_ARUDO